MLKMPDVSRRLSNRSLTLLQILRRLFQLYCRAPLAGVVVDNRPWPGRALPHVLQEGPQDGYRRRHDGDCTFGGAKNEQAHAADCTKLLVIAQVRGERVRLFNVLISLLPMADNVDILSMEVTPALASSNN